MSSSRSLCQAALTDYHLHLPLENKTLQNPKASPGCQRRVPATHGQAKKTQKNKNKNIFILEDIKLAYSCITFFYF